jgi:hypothetical protein
MAAGTERAGLKPGIYTPEEAQTAIEDGETLVVRGANWTPEKLREIQECMDVMHRKGIVPFKALAVPGDELGVEAPGGT